MPVIIISFVVFLLSFVGVGIYSSTRKKSTQEDYLVSGRDIPPWMMALSTMSTNNSGFMFIGMIGTTYVQGLSSIWIMVGWITGDYLIWRFVNTRLRQLSEQRKITTVPGFLANRPGHRQDWTVRRLAGFVTVIALGIYAAAQLKAGSKALTVLFGWELYVGSIIGSVIVAIYCFSGGIRASIWTDAVQALVMLFAMMVLVIVAIVEVGGFEQLFQVLYRMDPHLVSIIPPDLKLGFGMYLFGWLAAGIGVAGQPHIMIRSMTLDKAENMKSARWMYFTSYILFTLMVILVGLTSKVYFDFVSPEVLDQFMGDSFDQETALPLLSKQLLPEVLVGLILAGLFSATISTADSQVLACSAAISQDIFPRWGNSYYKVKLSTLLVTAIALLIAVSDNKNVFQLVTDAWALLGSTMAPMMILLALGKHIRPFQGLLMMMGGLAAVLFWLRLPGEYTRSLYAVLPGILGGFVAWALVEYGGVDGSKPAWKKWWDKKSNTEQKSTKKKKDS